LGLGYFILKAIKPGLYFVRRVETPEVHDVKGLTSLGTNYALTTYAPAERLRDSTTSMNIAGRNY
jgi:hypothetical protein